MPEQHRQHRPRVLIADEMALVAAGTRALLEPECDVVGTVADGRALLSEAEHLRPDIIVMEIDGAALRKCVPYM